MQPIKVDVPVSAGVESIACDCVPLATRINPGPHRPSLNCKTCGSTGMVSVKGRPWMQLVATKTAELAQRTPEERAALRFTPPPIVAGPPRPTVPLRFEHVRFTNFRVRNQNQTQQDALTAVKRWVERIIEGQTPMISLIGPTGVGKSHLLYSAAWQLFEKHQRAVFSRAWNYSLADALRYGTRPEGSPEVPAFVVREEFYRNRIVLLDEIRFTADTQFDSTELIKFANHAYDNGVSVLLTTNADPLSLVMGPEAADRFEKIVIAGTSYRNG